MSEKDEKIQNVNVRNSQKVYNEIVQYANFRKLDQINSINKQEGIRRELGNGNFPFSKRRKKEENCRYLKN